ncbi:GntR family transcriptional regulator [Proteiniclasticum sp. SCR006]|uniref:GntR family transcriptional regulator n=1 Tax=Proteiniclasticum aestuarii TaxID=2817862 RepID=A0A939H857_9CLOT|nr:GntR family transcriptional regulator [Proteiniclasticum aestuarii]
MPWNFDNSIPIYLQIIQEMKRRIIRKELIPGERLASVRDLAKEAGVNPNTMQKALSELEAEGLLETERTTGRFITSDQNLIASLREAYLKERLQPFLAELQSLGLSEEELTTLIRSQYKEATK